ncbi:conserved Plasmodium protein, unknown function [Plasmodium relictum]|uniref:PH domain-containing protein n=1 Tax=Plasmodium relictum TaxID=85471 RepID=A0A1J1H6A1_PLARL|nr:conserved Plasmodium protein, unknown function [Plasmodium relictum]CRH00284.1 conserved Plasmodium protein, unknown function [Plasmodium relictum]
MEKKKKNYKISDDNEISEINRTSKDRMDPLVKLKEEREKLIQWSIKLKNNSSSFLSSDKLDKDKSEKYYSSDESYNNNKYNNKLNNNSDNRKKKIDNEINYYEDKEDEIKENNLNCNDIVKIRLKGNMENKNRVHINFREKDSLNESLEDDQYFMLSNYKGGDVKLNSKLEKNKKGINNSNKENECEIPKNEKYLTENIFDKKKILSKEFDYISSNDSSADITQKTFSFNTLKKDINCYNNNNKINNYTKNVSDIHIREPFYKIPKNENKTGNNFITGNEEKMKKELYPNSDITFDDLGNNNLKNKKKIKLTRKKKNDNNNIHSFNLKNQNINYLNDIKIEKNNNKSSSGSIQTFLPITSLINSTENSSCTTIFSNNEINENKKINNDKIKHIEAKKMASLLKEKVNLLEKKKEILNDKMNDLHDNVYTLVDSKQRDNLAIQHYETLIKNLETKYNKLFNMYQELDEHRISYVEAYREKQTKIENLCAIMQIKSEENLKLIQEMNIINKKVEELQGHIYEYTKDIEEKEITLSKKKEENIMLKNSLDKANSEIEELKKKLEKKSKELNEMAEKYNSLQEENENIKLKYKETEDKYGDINNFYLPKIDNLQYIINKILQIFKLNDENILNYSNFFKENARIIEEKLRNNNKKYEDIILLLDSNLIDPIINVVKERESEYKQQTRDMENKFDDELLKMYENNINNIELAKNQIDQFKNKLASAILQRNNTKNKALLLSHGQGRLNNKSVIRELKKMNTGTLIYKCKYYTFKHKPVLIYMKIVDNKFITWSKNTKGEKGFKKKKLIDIKDVISIDFGINSRPVYWLIEKQNKKKLEKKKIESNQFYDNEYQIDPYKCFTLYTKKRAYDFFSDDEEVIATWVIGLGVLCYEYTKSPNIQSRSEFIIKKAQLKLKLYCIKNNINYTILWKDAIKKTQKQISK